MIGEERVAVLEGTICIPEQTYMSVVGTTPSKRRISFVVGATPGRRASSATQPRHFKYDAVFGPQSTQEQIFDSIGEIHDH